MRYGCQGYGGRRLESAKEQGFATSPKGVLSSIRLLLPLEATTPGDGGLKGFLMKPGLGTAQGPKQLILISFSERSISSAARC